MVVDGRRGRGVHDVDGLDGAVVLDGVDVDLVARFHAADAVAASVHQGVVGDRVGLGEPVGAVDGDGVMTDGADRAGLLVDRAVATAVGHGELAVDGATWTSEAALLAWATGPAEALRAAPARTAGEAGGAGCLALGRSRAAARRRGGRGGIRV